MQNLKEPKTSTIYLANGGHLITAINGISPEDDSGYVTVQGRELKVMPLPDLFRYLGYGEIVSITLQNGEVIEAVLAPEEYQHHVAYLYLNEGIEATICLFDEGSGTWREMTDQEYEQERRAWSEDMKDMQQNQTRVARVSGGLMNMANVDPWMRHLEQTDTNRCEQIEQLARNLLELVQHATTWPIDWLDKVDELKQRADELLGEKR